MNRRGSRFASAAVAILQAGCAYATLAACSPEAHSAGERPRPDVRADESGDGGAAVVSSEPLAHRRVPVACSFDSADGDAGAVGEAPSSVEPYAYGCRVDADCTASPRGRCVQYGLAPKWCVYDTCTSDSECGAETSCVCHGGVGSKCMPSECRVDADCDGGQYCVEASTSLVGGTSRTPSSVRCTTPNDACRSDSDCHRAGASFACNYDEETRRFACVELRGVSD